MASSSSSQSLHSFLPTHGLKVRHSTAQGKRSAALGLLTTETHDSEENCVKVQIFERNCPKKRNSRRQGAQRPAKPDVRFDEGA
jgi:hypothetical protein